LVSLPDVSIQSTDWKTPGERFAHVGEVPEKDVLIEDPKVRVFHGYGRTLIPGLGDAHTHMSWNGGDLDRLGELGVEEHTLLTARSARCFLDSGYTMFVLPMFRSFLLFYLCQVVVVSDFMGSGASVQQQQRNVSMS
jgi:hypothetical protein